jgi:hypothetical protein
VKGHDKHGFAGKQAPHAATASAGSNSPAGTSFIIISEVTWVLVEGNGIEAVAA